MKGGVSLLRARGSDVLHQRSLATLEGKLLVC